MNTCCRLSYMAAIAVVLAAMVWGGAQGQTIRVDPVRIKNTAEAVATVGACTDKVPRLIDWLRRETTRTNDFEMIRKLVICIGIMENGAGPSLHRCVAMLQRNNGAEAKKLLMEAMSYEMTCLGEWKGVTDAHKNLKNAVIDNVFGDGIDCLGTAGPRVFDKF